MKLLGLMLEIIGEGIESVIKYIGARFFFFRIDYFQREEKIKKRKMQKYRSSLFVESRSNWRWKWGETSELCRRLIQRGEIK